MHQLLKKSKLSAWCVMRQVLSNDVLLFLTHHEPRSTNLVLSFLVVCQNDANRICGLHHAIAFGPAKAFFGEKTKSFARNVARFQLLKK
jgi:hypothetical protein